MVLVAGLLQAAVAQAAGDPRPPSLPERMLKIELRCAADAPPPPALPPRPGDRVVGTSRPASGVTVGTSPQPGAGPVEVIVANGQPATLRWAGPEAGWDLAFDAAWAFPPAGRPPRTATPGGDPLVAVRLVRRIQALAVQPRWPGGERPVRVGVQLSTGHAAADAPAVDTVVDAPLDRWTPLGRLLPPDAPPGTGGCALQLRVRLS